MGGQRRLWKTVSWNGEFSHLGSKRIGTTNAMNAGFKDHFGRLGATKEKTCRGNVLVSFRSDA